MNKLTCPVCKRCLYAQRYPLGRLAPQSQIEGDICPNCETNLSTYKMLANLPVYAPIKKETRKPIVPIWLPISMAILFLILGIGLGFAGNTVLAKQQKQIPPITNIYSSKPTQPEELTTLVIADKLINKKIEQSESTSCGGFKYVVRKGDSLSLIASRFYGNTNFWSLISEANPAIQGKENAIEIGESLLIPNLKTNCLN